MKTFVFQINGTVATKIQFLKSRRHNAGIVCRSISNTVITVNFVIRSLMSK